MRFKPQSSSRALRTWKWWFSCWNSMSQTAILRGVYCTYSARKKLQWKLLDSFPMFFDQRSYTVKLLSGEAYHGSLHWWLTRQHLMCSRRFCGRGQEEHPLETFLYDDTLLGQIGKVPSLVMAASHGSHVQRSFRTPFIVATVFRQIFSSSKNIYYVTQTTRKSSSFRHGRYENEYESNLQRTVGCLLQKTTKQRRAHILFASVCYLSKEKLITNRWPALDRWKAPVEDSFTQVAARTRTVIKSTICSWLPNKTQATTSIQHPLPTVQTPLGRNQEVENSSPVECPNV